MNYREELIRPFLFRGKKVRWAKLIIQVTLFRRYLKKNKKNISQKYVSFPFLIYGICCVALINSSILGTEASLMLIDCSGSRSESTVVEGIKLTSMTV